MLVSMLPSDLDGCARDSGALVRRREVKSGEDLLRLAFVYGVCDLSLRSTARWAKECELADFSDVALLKRLRGAAPFLAQLLTDKLAERSGLPTLEPQPSPSPLRRVRLMDATFVCRPGARGTDFRIHLGFDLVTLTIDHVELTPASGGESLARLPVAPGDLLIADRGYSHRRGMSAVVEAGGDLIVRLNWHNLPLLNAEGQPFDLLAALRRLQPGEVGEFAVQTAPDPKEGYPAVPGRLIALAKSEQAAEDARRQLRKRAKKKGKTPSAQTLEAAGYVFVFTTLAPERLAAWDVLELYRFRWQIEVVFHRMKGLLLLDELTAKDEDLCRSVLLTKLLAALLVEELGGTAIAAVAFSPWGYGVPRPQSQSLAGLSSGSRHRASGHRRRLDPPAVANAGLPNRPRLARTAAPPPQSGEPSASS